MDGWMKQFPSIYKKIEEVTKHACAMRQKKKLLIGYSKTTTYN
ncbi:hypothetical protein COLO4_02817 [Corchorus olitorius]|uniref:Uncharacterized protein n=1 Tax=Corchorus olitorius TaxID=93759 RepID=A0A1R3L062_9ROSI|nr:hypothetical protein COLO4_02817 [Corchorus olitorius]